MFSYRALLKQAWNITRNYKFLWFFGLFASLTAVGGSIEYQILSNNLSRNLVDGSFTRLSGVINWSNYAQNILRGFIQLFSTNFLTILNALTLVILVVSFLVVIVWLAVSSQAGLIDSVARLSNLKKKAPTLNIREGLTNGHKHFWSILGFNILIRVLINFAFFLLSLPLLFLVLKDSGIFVVIYTIFFVIFIPISVSLSLMIKYAMAYKILEKESFVSSLEKGWKLFQKNWLVSLEMAVILFLVNFVAGFAMVLIVSLFILPLFILGSVYQMMWLTLIMLFLAVVVIVFIGSALVTFQITTWTGLFLRLQDKGAVAKLERLFRRRQ